MRLSSFPDEAAWLGAALDCFVDAASRAREAGRPGLDFCLAGGTTPAPLYVALAASQTVAKAFRGLELDLWLGDEREVVPQHGERNGRLVAEAFSAAPWAHRLHLWPAGPAAEAAAAYGAELGAHFGRDGRFDLALLGLGEDGHTASLFPGDPILGVEDALAWPSLAPSEPRRRMSLTYPPLRRARSLRFLVRGPGKRAIVEALAGGGGDYPATGLEGGDRAILYCLV